MSSGQTVQTDDQETHSSEEADMGGEFGPPTRGERIREHVEIKSCEHSVSRSTCGAKGSRFSLLGKESVNQGRFEHGSIIPNGTCPEFRIRGFENLEKCFMSNFSF
ncbi:hypothetical protein CDAR_540511 [Caerostris darwini]|uniref:Uncharacterized protein n=1 Tax=Caerostris darwini TaxID=1538125 RepID=A0AAV4PNH9_9ARAC|nr:hypothetical protein CDAR_540511 [Caerostris darwini]